MARTTRRVLTMQRLEGLHLKEWLATQPSQDARDHFGQLLWDVFLHCTFTLRRLQADPHPGNYLFMADGRLGLLNFGCTHALSDDFCTGLRTAWSALLRQPYSTCTPCPPICRTLTVAILGWCSCSKAWERGSTRATLGCIRKTNP